MLTVLLGGARSGKSTLAVELAKRSGRPVTFLATGVATDDEMAERIARHRAQRPAAWRTVEAPLELLPAVAPVAAGDTLIVDCLTLWLNNLMLDGRSEEAIGELGLRCARHLAARPGPTIVVSNEVGSGIVPADALSRRYRDLLGRLNATFAGAAERAYLVVAGLVLPLASLSEP